jgi:hypothetical protein
MKDDLVPHDIDVVAVARGPEDRHAAAFATVRAGELDGKPEGHREIPIRPVRTEAGNHNVCARRRIGALDLGRRVGGIRHGARQRGLRADLVAETGDQHQLAFGCRTAAPERIVVPRADNAGAERAVVAAGHPGGALDEDRRIGAVRLEETRHPDNCRLKVLVRRVETVVDHGDADACAARAVPGLLGADVGPGGAAILAGVGPLTLLDEARRNPAAGRRAANHPYAPRKETMKIRLVVALIGLTISFAAPAFAQQDSVDTQIIEQLARARSKI